MKQFYIALGIGLLAATASNVVNANDYLPASAKKVAEIKPAKVQQKAPLDYSNKNIIYNVPTQRVENVQSGYALFPDDDGFYLLGLEYDGKQTYISIDEENGKCYLLDPISRYHANSYIVGDLMSDEDNDVSFYRFTFPQCIYYQTEDSADTYMYAAVVTPDYTGQSYETIGKQQLDLIKTDAGWQWVLPSKAAVLGVVDNLGVWQYYAEADAAYTPMTDVVMRPPTSLETEEWNMVYGQAGHKMKIGFDGDDLWMQGFSREFPYSWLKGTVDGDKVRFEPFQYIGINNMSYYAWVCGGVLDTEDVSSTDHFIFADDLVMDYDAENHKITYDKYLLVESSKKISRTLDSYENPHFGNAQNETGSLVPRDPWVTYFFPKKGLYGESWMEFYVPCISIDDRLLDTSKLSYKIFLDEEELTFDPTEYSNFPEVMYELPWEFIDEPQWDIKKFNGAFRSLRIWRGGIENVGVQSIYRDGDQVYTSNVASYSSVKENLADKDVTSVSYTDLQGRKISNPEKGIYILTQTYSDGTKKCTKIIK